VWLKPRRVGPAAATAPARCQATLARVLGAPDLERAGDETV
jgi:hypothetical protein